MKKIIIGIFQRRLVTMPNERWLSWQPITVRSTRKLQIMTSGAERRAVY